MDFFDINDISFKKLYSVKIERKIIRENCLAKAFTCCSAGKWENIRAIITREGILEIREARIRDFLFFDSYFLVKSGLAETKHEFGVYMTSAHRKMKIKLKN